MTRLADSPLLSLRHRWLRSIAAVAAFLPLTSCGLFGDSGPIPVAAIGTIHRDPDRVAGIMSTPDRLWLDATAGGLVSFSADGQVEPGLAERWTVIDEGRSYIFRIREATWANGRPVRAADVVALLSRRMTSSRLRDALIGEFASITDIRAMTDRVLEIRLNQARPDLLDLLAQPDMAITRSGMGWGPWRPRWTGSTVSLSPQPLPGSAEAQNDDGTLMPAVARLWGIDALGAVTQYDAGVARAVFGGRFDSWPYVGAARIAPNQILIDPVDGLFGLAVMDNDGFLAGSDERAAVAMAIDRAAIANMMTNASWRPRITIRPATASIAIPPAYPAWADLSDSQRRASARNTFTRWRDAHGNRPIVLRIALPSGPGAAMLMARLRANLSAVGIDSRAVSIGEAADLRLIDEIAPSDDPAWYARHLSCDRNLSCSDAIETAVDAMDDSDDPQERRAAIGRAEAAIMAHGGFIPLAAPMRWSLVASDLTAIKANVRGRHSLIRLRASPN